MRQVYFFPMIIIILILAACAPAASPSEGTFTQPAQSPGNPPFTLTVVATPVPTSTATPIQEVLPTFAVPATPEPSSFSGLPKADCSVAALEEGIRLNPGPFINVRQLLPTMEPNVPYEVVDMYPTFYQLARDGLPVGWVEYMTLGLSGGGPGCAVFFERQPDTRALTEFAGLCFFTVDRPTKTFNDPALTELSSITLSTPSQPMVVLWKSPLSIFTSFGHAGPSFYVPADKVNMFGDCQGIPTSATVIAASWLWSKPDGQQGEKLVPLAAGLPVQIEGIPVEGAGPPESNADGAWVQAIVETQAESIPGWIWSALISTD